MDKNLIPIFKNESEVNCKLALSLDPEGSNAYYDRLLKYLVGYYVHINSNYNISVKDMSTNSITTYTTNFDDSFLNLDYILHDGLQFSLSEEGEYPEFSLEHYRE